MSTPEEPPRPRESRPPLWWFRLTGRDRGSTEPDGGMPAGEPGPEKWPKETMPFVPLATSPETAVGSAAERTPAEEAERAEPAPDLSTETDPSSEQDASAAVTGGPESGSPAGDVSEAEPEAPESGAGQAAPGGDASANGAVPPADSAEPRLQDPGTPAGTASSSRNGQTPASAAPEGPGVSAAAASDGPPGSAGSGPGSERPAAADVPAASQLPPGGDTPPADAASPAADGDVAAESPARPSASDVPAQDAAADHVPAGSETSPAAAAVPDATGPDATGPDATGPDATGEPVVGRVLPYGTGLGVDVTGPAELDRPRVARVAEAMGRQQLAEWVEIAHRSRVPSLSGRQGSDGSESISAAAVRAIARLACGYVHSDSDEEAVADQLMRNLISPPQISPAQVMQQYPTVTLSKKQLRLDLARVEEEDDAAAPRVELLRLPDQPGTGADGAPEEPGGRSAALVAAPRAAGTAAILWGPVAAIAAGHTYLSLDTIMAYARTHAFERVRDQRHTPQAAALGMRAVRALEIVVLVSAGMRRALWIDVDPADGEPAAVTAIDLDGGDGPYDMAARLL